MSTNDVHEHPIIGAQYTDYEGRTLRVIAIQPKDPLGREVVGKLKSKRWGKEPRIYSTQLANFYEVWVKRRPPVKSQGWG